MKCLSWPEDRYKTNMKEFVLKKKYICMVICMSVLSLCLSCLYIGYHHDLGKKDAYEYFRAAKFLEGSPVDGTMQLDRVLTTPAFLYASIVVDSVVHDMSTSFAVINVIFYLLCISAFYFLALEIYKEEKIAFLGTVLVLTNYYVIDPGNLHMADMGGWFFFLLATLWAVKYVNTSERKFYYFSLLTSAVGIFFKEYGGMGVVNLVLLITIMDIPWKQKIKDIIVAGVVVAVPLTCFYIFMYMKYHYLYFNRLTTAGTVAVTEAPKTFVLLVKILGWLFSFGWLASAYGVWEEWKTGDIKRWKILVALFPVTLTFYIWPFITQRLAVMFMMWLALLAGYGLSKTKWYILYPFLALYIWFNFNILFLIAKINLPF